MFKRKIDFEDYCFHIRNKLYFPQVKDFEANIVFEQIEEEWEYFPHAHDGYEVIYIIDGYNYFYIKDRLYKAEAGDLILISPDIEHHEFIQAGVYHVISFRFHKDLVPDTVEFPDAHRLEPVIHLPWQVRIRNLMEQIVIENECIDKWSSALINSYLTQFVVLLWRSLNKYRESDKNKKNGHREKISHIIDIINSSLNKNITMNYLADKAIMSESYFSHVFKNITNMAPKKYIIQTKLNQAKKQLSQSNKNIYEIAANLGYEDPYYFSRLFKNKFGLSPVQFRVNNRKVHYS